MEGDPAADGVHAAFSSGRSRSKETASCSGPPEDGVLPVRLRIDGQAR